MRVSVVTPCFNSARFLEAMLQSVATQRCDGLDVEHIVLDAGSQDGSREILRRHRESLARLIVEPDHGPADAINKGLALATGDVLGWLNADDIYCPNALQRACAALERHPSAALCFGHCPIIDAADREIRRPVTRFKEFWYPLSCRPLIQTLNYVSQPAMLFRRQAFERAGPLRLDLKAAWDYDFLLRLWRHGGAVRVPRPALACFRWTPGSISGQHFSTQFREELHIAAADAGRWAPQTLAHGLVRWGIVGMYRIMTRKPTVQHDCTPEKLP